MLSQLTFISEPPTAAVVDVQEVPNQAVVKLEGAEQRA